MLRVAVCGSSRPSSVEKAPHVCLLEMRHLGYAAVHFWARHVLVRPHWQGQLCIQFLMPCLEQEVASSAVSP